MAPKIFIIIPAFDESPDVIEETLKSLIRPAYEIVLVDDGSSTDLMRNSRALPVHYIRHAINLGQGASLQTGMDYAVRNGADVMVHFDADGQHNVGDIDVFIQKLFEGDYDIVLGSRFLIREDIQAVPKGR